MRPDQPIISIAPLACRLSDLSILSKTTGQPETIVHLTEPIILSVTVTFSGSGAIALLPLTPAIQVDFLAKSLHRREELELGKVILPSEPKQFTYTPAIALSSGFMAVGAGPNQAYFLSAFVRIGATGFPAFITGVIEGNMIQTYD